MGLTLHTVLIVINSLCVASLYVGVRGVISLCEAPINVHAGYVMALGRKLPPYGHTIVWSHLFYITVPKLNKHLYNNGSCTEKSAGN